MDMRVGSAATAATWEATHGPRLPTGSVDGSSNDPGRPLGFRIADRTRGGAGRSGGRPLGFADSNRRRAVAIPRRIRASGNGDSGYASAEGAWKGGEEELAGVRLGRRAAARSRSGGRRLRVGWLSRSPGALPRWSGAGAEERRGSSRRSAASRQAGNSKSHATLYQKDIRCSVFAPEPYDPPTIGCPGKVLLLGADHRNREIHVRLVLATNERASKMASIVASSKVVALGALILFLLVFYGSCTSIVNFNASHITADPYWVPARATWYGLPTGAGPYDNGGACGFKNVNLPPFSAMTSCGNQPLFKDGKGCGSCYQIRCLNHPACSGNPETVSITDMNYYPVAKYHFDLSGTAFGALAKPGRNDELRHAGIIDIQFKRVPCIYPGQTVTFHIEHGSNPNYLAVLVEFEDGDGDVVQVDLMEANSGWWMPMRESWGSIWRMDRRRPLTGPFSLRITNESGQKLVAYQVIPANWAPNAYYRSNIQYDAFSNGAGAGAGAGLDIGSATGLVISSAAQLDTKILGVIVLICLVLCRLHRLMCCRS